MSRFRLSRLLPHHDRLMHHGTPGRAVVLRSEPTKLTASAAYFAYRLTLEVHYDDGTTAEIVRTVTPFEVRNQHTVGDVLPVRYSPADHTDVDLDLAALRQEQEAEDARIDERRVAAARASLAPPAADGEQRTAAWLDQLMRLRVGHADGAVTDSQYAAGVAKARADLRDGSALFVTGDDADHVVALAAAIVGDPISGHADDVANAQRAAALLETIVRLKLRHESGELDDAQWQAAAAAVQEEAERLD